MGLSEFTDLLNQPGSLHVVLVVIWVRLEQLHRKHKRMAKKVAELEAELHGHTIPAPAHG